MSEDSILGIDQEDFFRLIFVLFLAIVSIGSLANGIFSGEYFLSTLFVVVPLIIFFYMTLVSVMFLMGMDPSKFEIIFIPTIILVIIVGGFSIFNFNPLDQTVDDAVVTSSVTSSEDTDAVISSDGGVIQTPTSVMQTGAESGDPGIFSFVIIIVTISLLVVGGGIILYRFLTREDFDPVISISKEMNYSEATHRSNRSIIELYKEASEKVEELKGRAPEWYSPTFFADHVESSPGPPLSSYFDRLTALYELARFSEMEMSQSQVDEAKDLSNQIFSQIEMIFEQLREYKDQEGEGQ